MNRVTQIDEKIDVTSVFHLLKTEVAQEELDIIAN